MVDHEPNPLREVYDLCRYTIVDGVVNIMGVYGEQNAERSPALATAREIAAAGLSMVVDLMRHHRADR